MFAGGFLWQIVQLKILQTVYLHAVLVSSFMIMQ